MAELELENEVKTSKKNKDESVTLTKEQFDTLISRIEASEQGTKRGPVSVLASRTKNWTLRLREIDGKVILDVKRDRYGRVIFKEMKNEKGNPDMLVTLILLKEGKLPTDVDALEEKPAFHLIDFLNGSHEIVVPIIKTREEESFTSYGVVTKKYVPENEFQTIDTGREIAAESREVKRFHLVRLPDGREIEVNDEFINI